MRKYLIFILIILLMIPGSYAKLPQGVIFWSNQTKQFFETSRINIDRHTYVVAYDLQEGWVKIHTDIPEIIALCDPFSGHWVKKYITGTENITLPFTVIPYNGLRIVIISTPTGFGVVKEVEKPLSFWDYPVLILKSELAKFGWIRAFYSASLLIAGLALARYLKKDKLIVSMDRHITIAIFFSIIILSVLGMTYTVDTIRINQTVKHVPHLIFSTYRIKDMYNYCYVFFFLLGYIIGWYIWSYSEFYVCFVGYNKPISIRRYPYDKERKLIRDFDGKLTSLKLDLKQYIHFEFNGYEVPAILVVREKEYTLDDKVEFKPYSLAGFFGFFVISILGDFLNVFRIDLPYAFIMGTIIVLITNKDVITQWLGLNIEKIKEFECSRLMTEDNYVRMLKEAEILHLSEEYDKLFVEFAKLGTIAKARAIKLLSRAGKIVSKEIDKMRGDIHE